MTEFVQMGLKRNSRQARNVPLDEMWERTDGKANSVVTDYGLRLFATQLNKTWPVATEVGIDTGQLRPRSVEIKNIFL